jgi:hypothetical protein
LKAYLDHTQGDKIKSELVYVFIDEDKKRVARLEEEIAKLGTLPKNVVVHVVEGSFQERFTEALDSVEEKGAKLAPTFAFIDPFGYTDAPMSLSGRFLQFDRCEVLIFHSSVPNSAFKPLSWSVMPNHRLSWRSGTRAYHRGGVRLLARALVPGSPSGASIVRQ